MNANLKNPRLLVLSRDIKKSLAWALSFICMLFASSAFGNAPLTLFPIDTMQRGIDIQNLIVSLEALAAAYSGSEVAIQTAPPTPYVYAPYLQNNLIPYVQKVIPAPNSTLLIVYYSPSLASNTQYLVVPIEQITTVVYSPFSIQPSFLSTYPSSVLPLYSVDPAERAADIKSIVTTLLTEPPYTSSNSSVSILTTLSGPFYPGLSNGLIKQVIGINTASTGSSLLIISYLNSAKVPGTIIVAAEQVQQIVYYPIQQ